MIGYDEALQRLVDGNERYAAGRSTHARADAARRAELLGSQEPFAVILGCADSRVPPEIIFDQGLGDLFVVRVAGNVATDDALGSIEYAAAHLDVPLVMVLGHSRCGAVTAAVAGGDAEGHLPGLMSALTPAVEASRGQAGDAVDNAARMNARMTAQLLALSEPVLKKLVDAGAVRMVAAFYDLDSGRVEILD